MMDYVKARERAIKCRLAAIKGLTRRIEDVLAEEHRTWESWDDIAFEAKVICDTAKEIQDEATIIQGRLYADGR